MAKAPKAKKEPDPTGVDEIDRLAALTPCTMADYIRGVSAYVKAQSRLDKGPKKASQIRLANALARALAHDLVSALPDLNLKLVTEERKVAGGLRTANADVSESHTLDGLRLAVELKPINLAVGRAIWNRFGDIRTFAVNIHLKFPFAVVGGVLVIPVWEEVGTAEAQVAEREELAVEDYEADDQTVSPSSTLPTRKTTTHLIERAIDRLVRAGGRRSEAEAAHLLEGIAVVVYDPDTAMLSPDLPARGKGLRWEEFVADLASAYRARFEN